MNKEELNNVVCECANDYEILNCAYDYIEKLEEDNKQLKDNWNKLKEYFTSIINYYPIDSNPLCEIAVMTYEDINYKMQELERGE